MPVTLRPRTSTWVVFECARRWQFICIFSNTSLNLDWLPDLGQVVMVVINHPSNDCNIFQVKQIAFFMSSNFFSLRIYGPIASCPAWSCVAFCNKSSCMCVVDSSVTWRSELQNVIEKHFNKHTCLSQTRGWVPSSLQTEKQEEPQRLVQHTRLGQKLGVQHVNQHWQWPRLLKQNKDRHSKVKFNDALQRWQSWISFIYLIVLPPPWSWAHSYTW